jgi:uncharacterized membrane protein
MTSGVRCWCQHCDRELKPSHTGKCPYCGETGKRCEATASVTLGLKVSASATRTRAYFEWGNKKIRALIGAIAIDAAIASVSTVVGFFVSNALGALIGFVVSLVIIIISNVFFKRRVKTIIREIKEI